MGRVPSVNYAAETDTTFEWATTDNDMFDREKDLYRLALALEKHDHSRPPGQNITAGRGAPLGSNAISTQSVTNAMLAPGAVTTDKIQDGTIKSGDIEAGTIARDRMNVNYLPLRPDTNNDALQNDIRISRYYATNQGAIYFGTGATFLSYDGLNMFFGNAANGYLQMECSAFLIRGKPTPSTLYLYLGTQAFFYTTGTSIECNVPLYISGQGRVLTTADQGATPTVIGVPLGGVLMFRAASEVPNTANWEIDPSSAGRLLVGAGNIGTPGTPPGGFVSHQGYPASGITWVPVTNLAVDATAVTINQPGTGQYVNNTTTAANSQASATTHTHTMSGTFGLVGKDAWIPPSYAVTCGRRRA